jgi:uncharacterized membrane protein YcaP (DUF421 family)
MFVTAETIGLINVSSKMLFDGYESLIRTLILGVLAYAALVLLLRVSGKRTLSKMNAFDFVVTVALGSTLASMFVSKDVALAQGVLGLALLIGLQWINTFIAVRVKAYRRILKAEPTLLLYRGEFLHDAMKRERVSEDEILAAARSNGVAEIQELEAVIMETEGSLSIITGESMDRKALRRMGITGIPDLPNTD